MKKTISVAETLNMANNSLASKENSNEFKEGICTMIEAILHKTGNYKGFQYLYWLDKGCKAWEKYAQIERLNTAPPDEYIYGTDIKGYGKFARKYY